MAPSSSPKILETVSQMDSKKASKCPGHVEKRGWIRPTLITSGIYLPFDLAVLLYTSGGQKYPPEGKWKRRNSLLFCAKCHQKSLLSELCQGTVEQGTEPPNTHITHSRVRPSSSSICILPVTPKGRKQTKTRKINKLNVIRRFEDI